MIASISGHMSDAVGAPGSSCRPPSVRSSLAASVLEAASVGGMFACLEAWIVPLVQGRLGAAAAVIGFLAMLPQLSAILLGPFTGAMIARLGGPRRVAIHHGWFQVAGFLLLQIPLAVSVEGHPPAWAVPLAVAVVVVMNGVGAVFGGPAWVAWMGGLIPHRVMGRFTGHRNRIFHISRLAFAGLFALVMMWLPLTAGIHGLQFVLAVAAASRLASICWQTRQIDPVPRRGPLPSRSRPLEATITTFRQFLGSLTTTPFGKFTLVWSLLNIGLQLAGPYYATFLVAKQVQGGLDLGSQAVLYSVLVYLNTVVRLFFYPYAGRLVDRIGAATAFNRCLVMMALIPLGWGLAALTEAAWPVLIIEVFSGFAWALADLSVGPLLFRCHSNPAQRSRLVGWHSTVVNVCCVAGTGLGMLLLALPAIPGVNPYLVLFGFAFLLRIPAVVLARKLMPEDSVKGEPVSLWRMIPGADIPLDFGRSVFGRFFRPDDD